MELRLVDNNIRCVADMIVYQSQDYTTPEQQDDYIKWATKEVALRLRRELDNARYNNV